MPLKVSKIDITVSAIQQFNHRLNAKPTNPFYVSELVDCIASFAVLPPPSEEECFKLIVEMGNWTARNDLIDKKLKSFFDFMCVMSINQVSREILGARFKTASMLFTMMSRLSQNILPNRFPCLVTTSAISKYYVAKKFDVRDFSRSDLEHYGIIKLLNTFLIVQNPMLMMLGVLTTLSCTVMGLLIARCGEESAVSILFSQCIKSLDLQVNDVHCDQMNMLLKGLMHLSMLINVGCMVLVNLGENFIGARREFFVPRKKRSLAQLSIFSHCCAMTDSGNPIDVSRASVPFFEPD
jgi:hypothetical protein